MAPDAQAPKRTFSVRLTEEEIGHLRTEARRQDRSVNYIIQLAVRDYLGLEPQPG